MDALLPHGVEALLIEAVLADTGAESVCSARVPADSPFRRAGGAEVPAFLALEMGAQAAAVIEAHRRARSGGGPAPAGVVVAARDARFHSARLPADRALTVTTRLVESAPPLRTYRVEVREGAVLHVEGTISTWLAEEER